MAIRRNTSLIAVDFGTATVRLLQLAGSQVTALEVPCEIFAADPVHGTDDPGGLAEDLRRLASGGGLQGSRCAVTLPATAFLTDTVPLPELDPEERQESLAVEAVDRFGVDPGDASVAALPLRTPTAAIDPVPPAATTPPAPTPAAPAAAPVVAGQEHLLLALPRRTAMRALEPLLAAGLTPVRLESAALAGLRTAWVHWSRQVEGPIAFVHVEPTQATMLLARDGELVFHRAIAGTFGPPRTAPESSIGAAQTIPVEVRAPGADRRAFRWSGLADEILQCLRYVERRGAGQWPAALVASGPCACQVELLATLESICGVPANAASGAGIVDPLPATLSPSMWASALGSAAVDLEPRAAAADARRAA